MIDDFTTQALAYLFDELDPKSRAEFEQLMARDPVAAAAFKACADSVALYAMAEAPPTALDARDRGEVLAAVLRAATAGGDRARTPGWRRYLWPLAAAALLALNVGQWAFHRGEGFLAPWLASHGGHGSGEAAAAGATGSSDKSGALPAVSPRDTGREVAKELGRLAALRLEYARLQGSRDALNTEYRQILQQLAVQVGAEQASGRIVAMELVDGASYASGDRTGLMDLSSTILSKPGVAAAGPPINTNPTAAPPSAPVVSSTTPPVSNAPASTSSVVSSTPGTATMAGATVAAIEGATTATVTGDSLVTAPINTASGASSATFSSSPASTGTSSPAQTTAGAPGTTATASAASTPAADTPYAVSLYDPGQNQGYLDLYNLPQVAADQSLQLWVQPAGSQNFQNVGEIPSQFYGESGGIYYKLPSGTATPAQIMITVESRATTPVAPTGTVVLRGP